MIIILRGAVRRIYFGNLCNPVVVFVITLKVNAFFLPRAKLFRGKKILGDYDIKVEQVQFISQMKSIASTL